LSLFPIIHKAGESWRGLGGGWWWYWGYFKCFLPDYLLNIFRKNVRSPTESKFVIVGHEGDEIGHGEIYYLYF